MLSTKEKILKSATKLFSEKSFSSSSVRDIAKDAGVNIGSINHHFGSKDKLFWAARRQAVNLLDESLLSVRPKNSSELAKAIVKTFTDLGVEFRLALTVLVSNDFPDEQEILPEGQSKPSPPGLKMIRLYFKEFYEECPQAKLATEMLFQIFFIKFMMFDSKYVKKNKGLPANPQKEMEKEFVLNIELLTSNLTLKSEE